MCQNLYTSISFQSNQYTATEGVDESVTITVVRYGDISSDLRVTTSISGENLGESKVVDSYPQSTVINCTGIAIGSVSYTQQHLVVSLDLF